MAVLLPHHPKCWDYRSEPCAQLLYLPLFVLRFIYLRLCACICLSYLYQVCADAHGGKRMSDPLELDLDVGAGN